MKGNDEMNIYIPVEEAYDFLPSAQTVYDTARSTLNGVANISWDIARVAGGIVVAGFCVEGAYGVAQSLGTFVANTAPTVGNGLAAATETVVGTVPEVASGVMALAGAHPVTAIAVTALALAAGAYGVSCMFSDDEADARIDRVRAEANAAPPADPVIDAVAA
jgi:hypothetical protein